MPASSFAPRMPRQIRSAGAAVAWKPDERPWMMFVAWPVCEARAVIRTGRKRVDV